MNRKALHLLDDATDFVLDSLALVLGDHLALGVGLGGAHLLHDGGALLLEPGGALLVLDGGTLLLVNSSLDSPRHINTALLRNAVALVLEHLLALLLHINGGLTLLLELGPALPLGLRVLNWPLRDLTLPLVSVGAHSIRHILTLPPPDSLVCSLGHLLADLLGHLAAGGGRLTDEGRRIELQRQVHSQGQEQRGGENKLHLGWMEAYD